jgi:hypothetical protein
MNKFKWLAASINITASLLQATAILSIQWIAWSLLIISVIFWGIIAYKEKDFARLTQQTVFITIASIALYNWLKHAF